MTDPHIEAALDEVKHGGIDAYAVVVDTYQRRLRSWLAGVTPPGVDADELAHRAFIEAYKQIGRYRAGTEFYSWLSVIARNLLLAELKRLQRAQKNTANYLHHLVVTGLIESALEPTDLQERRIAALRACQEALSPGSQALLRARYGADAPLETLAGRFGKTVAAIKFQLFAIRRKLRDCVRKRLEANPMLLPPAPGAEAL